MKVVTVATDLKNRFLTQLLGPSCEATGLELVVLHADRGAFEFADKRRILAEHLPSVADRDELVVFTDAYDTFFIRGQRHIEAAYERFAEPVVFSGELNSWPLGAVGVALDGRLPAGRYPYLNSGGFVGTAGDILDLCARYPEPPTERFELLRQLRSHGYDLERRYSWSDQFHWTLVRLVERELIGVDHDAKLFECLGPPIPELEYREVMRDVREFAERGVDAGSYRRERERLVTRLQSQSGAAQVHFAGSVTKAVAWDLFRDGLLPAWLAIDRGPGSSRLRPDQVVRV